ncbi:LDH2 family malate/lactate/ureidoglycolate dehydrogenase [Nocardioides salarius]|uniref:LDH2 family malate/lactate/ureidoglycolate dehydrogenase n=1 Tax=Nocardioides salarius TaxID=374513 RepID=A0ABS2MA67_9ACTN|nr:Ldh family oxidoreductase [Nocardioides salarius]MBM7508064.1 LDH2 family malate/lactate/ureidoglycolate dehydrogenase [Nocardioides salarius]
MKIRIAEARALVADVMSTYGYDAEQSAIISDHLIDTELRGFSQGGLARAVTLTERLDDSEPFGPITTIQETVSSLAIDGGDQAGYIVARELTERLIDKCETSAAVVGTARNTWCTGMFSYYLEILAAAGLMGFIASSGGPYVAPYGASEARFGTNPVAFGFPTDKDPVIWDIGTSSLMLADLTIAKKHGAELPTGLAFTASGETTTDPSAVLDGGTITTWGGHKGSGLALAAQLLGMMAGSAIAPPWLTDMGFFMFVVDPAALSPDFPARASEFVEIMHATRPVDRDQPVRVPFERSIALREQMRAAGEFEVEDRFVEALRGAASRRPA